MYLILKHIATLGFIGYLPFAPGTFGTLAASLSYILLKPSYVTTIMILIVLVPLSIYSSHFAEKMIKIRDSKHIVIDEFCGYYFATLYIPYTLFNSITAFFIFRIFDILKPFPIRKLESMLKGGVGIVADDILAGIYTNIIIQVILLIDRKWI
jgi:phosphatidylglycerophosphatase A